MFKIVFERQNGRNKQDNLSLGLFPKYLPTARGWVRPRRRDGSST